MCGFAGILQWDGSDVRPDELKRLGDALEHRGIDDLGYLSWNGNRQDEAVCHRREVPGGCVGFVHRRLSILDLTDAAWQPMSSADNRHHIVFNGEVYNYLELRDELEKLGHKFRSNSDTEVVLAAFEQWGSEALKRFIGAFAFAILQTDNGKLFLGRDFFGIKPLYYTRWAGGLAFASEIKALLELPHVAACANPQRVYDYLRFGITDHGTETTFAGIYQMPSAHWAEIDIDTPGEVTPVRYWDIETSEPMDISFDEASRRLREMFLENVKLHLRSDVPVGVTLSGGIDSSAIVMAMRAIQGKQTDIHTFTHIADGPLGEGRWANIVNHSACAQGRSVRPQPAELVADLDDLIAIQDEPFGSTSIYAQMRVFRLARDSGIKVILGGQGADELLAGYRPYLAARAVSLLRRGKITKLGRYLRGCSQLPGVSMTRMLLRAGGLILPDMLQGPARYLTGQELFPAWMQHQWFRRAGVRADLIWRAKGSEVLREHLRQSIADKGLPALLRYEDRNSMAHSVESRVPFLTPEMVNFTLGLPEEYLISADGVSKSVFRHAMRGLVDDEILNRRDKIGFSTPQHQWLEALQPWVKNVLQSERARDIPALRIDRIMHMSRKMTSKTGLIDETLWRCLNLIRWAERFDVSFEV